MQDPSFLTRDTLFLLALELDVPDLLNLCLTYPRIDDLICQREDIWLNKLKPFYNNLEELQKDVDDFMSRLPNTSIKDIFSLIYSLNVVKQFLNKINHIHGDLPLVDLYNLEKLYLTRKQIIEVPRELGNLLNLQELYLCINKIEEIPKEFGNLVKLRILNLFNNQIKEIPKELGNLINLQTLYVDGNVIIPEEILNIPGSRIIGRL